MGCAFVVCLISNVSSTGHSLQIRTSYSNTNYLGENNHTGALFVVHSDVWRPLL